MKNSAKKTANRKAKRKKISGIYPGAVEGKQNWHKAQNNTN
jgi:hypothetical protein